VSLSLNGQLGLANGYSGQSLPFFKNFFGGGVGSVRGFGTSTLGPRDASTGVSVGGTKLIVAQGELLFPFPGIKTDKSVRLSFFTDAGNVYGAGESPSFSSLRMSVGTAFTWYSPVGPLKFSYALPLKTEAGDTTERLQFTLGSSF
jgi:outer membrane protein insertion porin family